jgi:anaerobic dimethyl sulfoxide reductase subunit A
VGSVYHFFGSKETILKALVDRYRERWMPDLPDFEDLLAEDVGAWTLPVTEPIVALEEFRRDPVAHPLATPSGRIELFSLDMHRFGRPDVAPAVPKYVQEWESPFDENARRHPLQCLGHHTLARVHSTHDNNEWLREAHPQRLWMHPFDAEPRGLHDGDLVRVFNDRGETRIECALTRRILPGVVDLPQGAWWTPDENGVDHAGSINVLTADRWTPFAFGAAMQTVMVQVEGVST